MKSIHFDDIVRKQFLLYPEMEIQDLYKLVYQGVMGSGHAVSSTEKAMEWLTAETEHIGEGPSGEALMEEIAPGGFIVRVNLRPYLRLTGDTGRLFNAFIRTGREFAGDTADLEKFWKLAESVQTVFSAARMAEYFAAQREAGFQAVHHSQGYRDLYRPAYRVALKKFLEEEGVIT